MSLGPTPATAGTPTGTCTSSYTSLTYEDVSRLPDADLALAIFPIVDSNRDNLVCSKPYPNGDHNGHYGSFVDDKAAPHS